MQFARMQALVALVLAAVAGPALAELQPREVYPWWVTSGGFYDTTLDITWLAQPSPGLLSYEQAQALAADADFGGIGGWRLPLVANRGRSCLPDSVADGVCGFNVNVADNELAHLYYVDLGLRAPVDPSGLSDPDYHPLQGGKVSNVQGTATFVNVMPGFYWTSSFDVPPFLGTCPDGANCSTPGETLAATVEQGWWRVGDQFFRCLIPAQCVVTGGQPVQADQPWRFNLSTGLETDQFASDPAYVWLVHDGDVGIAITPVPEPRPWALLVAGLAWLSARAARRRLR